MAKWKKIILHCSDSTWGTVTEIRKWHLQRGFSDIGYHFVVLNGKLHSDIYMDVCDGSIEIGRAINSDKIVQDTEIGAHALGHNSDSIGICLIGKNDFSMSQITSCIKLAKDLMHRYEIPDILGHYEVDAKKTCPNIDMKLIRAIINKVKY